MKFFFFIFLLFIYKVTCQTSSCNENESKLAAVTNLVCNDVSKSITTVTRGKKGPKGDKGDPGISCDVTDSVETLIGENKDLKQEVATLRHVVDDVVAKLNETYFGYTFRITPNRGNFEDCRKQCQFMGGELIHLNFGGNGVKYHPKLRKMMESSGKNLWVGVTDIETEGTFKYLNGQTVNAKIDQDQSQDKDLLYYFDEMQPNEGRSANCVHFVYSKTQLPLNNALNDAPCNFVTNRWGRGVDYHGLCEMENLF